MQIYSLYGFTLFIQSIKCLIPEFIGFLFFHIYLYQYFLGIYV
jgi:hypothetical protein